MVVEAVQAELAGIGFREDGPVRTDEGDADVEFPADAVEGRSQRADAAFGRRFHLHADEPGLPAGVADGFLNAVFLDVLADVQPRQHQRHDDDGQKAEEEARPELGVVHVTPCSGILRPARFR